MKLRNFAEDAEVLPCRDGGLAKHYRQFPDQLTQDRSAPICCIYRNEVYHASSQNVAISGLRFFYQQVLGWNEEQFSMREKTDVAVAGSVKPQEVERLLVAAVKLSDRCLLMAAYSAGLRVTELIHLKLSDVDPERMMIRVEQGKGRKDRYTILSQRLLSELKKYKQTYQPVLWVFFGKTRNNPTAHHRWRRKSITSPSRKVVLKKAKAFTRCATVSPPIC